MDELEIEKGYVNFHRKLNRILRQKEVKAFKAHVAAHPMQAGRLSHCLGLSDELAEIEMYKAIVVRSALRDVDIQLSSLLTNASLSINTSLHARSGPGVLAREWWNIGTICEQSVLSVMMIKKKNY